MLTQPAISTRYVEIPVTLSDGYNPTDDPVYLAYMTGPDPDTQPAAGDWTPAVWKTVGADYLACGLVGPDNDGTVLPIGVYNVWVKITDSPEVPEEPAGYLQIY